MSASPFAPPIDALLKSVAPLLARHADDILDIREAVLNRNNPGRCVRCYFSLFTNCKNPADLGPLRRWIEQHIEMIATDRDSRLLETLPVQLDADDLESFCRKTINEFRENRCYDELTEIALGFRYKAAA